MDFIPTEEELDGFCRKVAEGRADIRTGRVRDGGYYDSGWPPVELAIRQNRVEILEWLMENGANFEGVLASADSLYLEMEALRWLLEHAPRLGFTRSELDAALKNAANGYINGSNTSLKQIWALLDAGADVNAGRCCVLDAALWRQDWDAARGLLARGADPGIQSERFLMLVSNHPEMVELLIQHGADVNYSNSAGDTVLSMLLTDTRRPPFDPVKRAASLRLCLEHGADPNGATPAGWTPLMYASVCGMPEIVKLLLDYGADVHARDLNGKSALDFARDKRRDAVVDLLTAAGACI